MRFFYHIPEHGNPFLTDILHTLRLLLLTAELRSGINNALCILNESRSELIAHSHPSQSWVIRKSTKRVNQNQTCFFFCLTEFLYFKTVPVFSFPLPVSKKGKVNRSIVGCWLSFLLGLLTREDGTETSVNNCHTTPRNIPEERRSQKYCSHSKHITTIFLRSAFSGRFVSQFVRRIMPTKYIICIPEPKSASFVCFCFNFAVFLSVRVATKLSMTCLFIRTSVFCLHD